MSEDPGEKRRGLIDRYRELSGIYGLGFEKESFLGFMVPFVIVIVVGGLLGWVILRGI